MPIVLCKTLIQQSVIFSQTVKWLSSGDLKVTELFPFSFNYKLASYLKLRYLELCSRDTGIYVCACTFIPPQELDLHCRCYKIIS